MKHLSILTILALVSTIVYSQISIRVEGSAALVELNSDGTYCYSLDPDNLPKHSDITLNTDFREALKCHNNPQINLICPFNFQWCIL